MAVPSGFTPLAKIGLLDRGEYDANETYNTMDFVQYRNSSWVAKKDGLKGVTPEEGDNWKYLARGFENDDASGINITDTSNITGVGAGKKTILQTWADKIGEWIVNKAITNDNFVTKLTERLVNNGTTTASGFALDGRYGKTLTDQISELNAKHPGGGIGRSYVLGGGHIYGVQINNPTQYTTLPQIVFDESTTCTLIRTNTDGAIYSLYVDTSEDVHTLRIQYADNGVERRRSIPLTTA